jgi:hypothetical protein
MAYASLIALDLTRNISLAVKPWGKSPAALPVSENEPGTRPGAEGFT